MRSHEEFIISVEMDPIVLSNGDLPEILEFLMYSTKGHVVAPIYLYMIWEEGHKIDDHGNFYFSFNSLTDYMLFKLAYDQYILNIGVFTPATNDMPWDNFNIIKNVSEISKYRPNAVIDI